MRHERTSFPGRPVLAVYPGSFDPLHSGHLHVLRRARVLFADLTVLVARNPAKTSTLQVEGRVQSIRSHIEVNWDNVKVDSWPGLTVDYCRDHGIAVIVRGVRNRRDFLYETQLAAMNRSLAGIETLLLPASADLALMSSSLIRLSDKPAAEDGGEHD